MVQCGFAVVGFPNIDSMPPGPDYNSSSTTGEDGDVEDVVDQGLSEMLPSLSPAQHHNHQH